MKKVLSGVLMIIFVLSLGGCTKTAKTAVENYLAMYTSLDENVLTDMNTIIESENLTDENRSVYESIFKKQYSDLSYEITDEKYSGDEATVTVKISVYDLFDGKTFLEYVLDGSITDYDGSIAEILVDGYISNLGLRHRGIRQGQFLTTKRFWEELMETDKIEVNWANK